MIIEHEEFGIGEIMAGSERLDESTGILYADVLFEDDVRFDMAIGVMSEGMGKYPGGRRTSPTFYGNDPEKNRLIKQKFDEIEKNFGKPKQEKKPANEEAEVNEIFDNTQKGGANASKYLNARTSAKGRHISQEPEKKQALVYRTIKKAQRRNDLSSVSSKLANNLTREEVEQIDELSKKSLRNYKDKNEEDRIKLSRKIGIIRNGKMTKDQEEKSKKLEKRVKGDDLASKKMYPSVYKNQKPAKVNATEEVEQIDELDYGKGSSSKGSPTGDNSILKRYLHKTENDPSRKSGRELAMRKMWPDAPPGPTTFKPPKVAAKNEEVEQIDELSKDKLKSYVKAKKAAIPYQAKDKEIEKAEKKIKKMNEDNEPKVSGYTEMSRMKAVESVARSIMSQNRDLRQESLISDFNSRNHQANNNKGE